MEEAVEIYLENERIIGDQVLLILVLFKQVMCLHDFVKNWVVVTNPIHLYRETAIALQFSVAYY